MATSHSAAGWLGLICLCHTVTANGITLNFNPDWRFIRGDPAGAEQVVFDDADWQEVAAPHTYNDTDTFDNWSPSGHRGEMDQWGGRTWYRKTFEVPADWRGKRVMVEFEAVRQVTEVYLNGHYLGKSQNGFVPFGFDLTDHLAPGEEQVLAVMCDNSFAIDDEDVRLGGKKGADVDYSALAHNEGAGKAFSWNNPHWHPAHGGIYRNVTLHVKNPAHFTLPLYRSLGTVGGYSYATDISRGRATAHMDAEVINTDQAAKTLRVSTQWNDGDGRLVAEAAGDPRQVAPGTKAVFQLRARIARPRLWEPGHPHIYQVRNRLYEGDVLLDEHVLPLGIRTFAWTTHAGVFINDRHVKLRGWGQKSTDEWPGLGAAQPDWLHFLTLRMMHDAGGNMVRWGHTAGGPAHIRASDQLGMVVVQPGVDGEGDITGEPWTERAATFRDMIVYFRNHPSIMAWEGGNQSVSKAHVEELTQAVRTYDPHGGRAYTHRRANAVVEPYCNLTLSTEGSGFRKGLPTVEGEYNREESPRRVWDDFSPPDFDYKGAAGTYDLTSEQFAVNQVFQYDKISPLFHGGGANWIFSDSTSGGRVQSEVARASGEVDGVRLPKQAHYVCKVLFSDEPDVHLIGHWSYPADTVKDLFVASDCQEVELLLNGRSLGRQAAFTGASDPTARRHANLFVFPQITFEPGRIEAVGLVGGEEADRYVLETAGAPAELRLSPITGPRGFQATGSDVLLVDVEVVDAQGLRCPTWQDRVDFNLNGPGVWRGGYNSGKTNSINHLWLDLEGGINRVAVRSTPVAGEVNLRVHAAGLPPASITVPAEPMSLEHGCLDAPPAFPPPDPLGDLPRPTEHDRMLLAGKTLGSGDGKAFEVPADVVD